MCKKNSMYVLELSMVLDSWGIGRNPPRAIGNDYNEKSNRETGEFMAGYYVLCTGREVGTADFPASRCVEEPPSVKQELNIFLIY